MRRHRAWARATAAALALVTGLTMAAGSASAADANPVAAKTSVGRPSLTAAALKAAENAPRTALAQTADTPAAASDDGGFLSSKKGKIAAAVFVGALAWTIYSVSDGREPVKSPVR